MKITNENVRALATKGTKITRTNVVTEYMGAPDGSVYSLPVLRTETYTVTQVRRFKDGRTRLAVTVDGAGYGCTLAFPMPDGVQLEVAQ